MVNYPGEKVLFDPPIMINLIIGNLFRNGTRTSEVLALTGAPHPSQINPDDQLSSSFYQEDHQLKSLLVMSLLPYS